MPTADLLQPEKDYDQIFKFLKHPFLKKSQIWAIKVQIGTYCTCGGEKNQLNNSVIYQARDPSMVPAGFLQKM